MAEKNLNDVSSTWRELYQKGCATLNQGDADAAVVLFNQVLDAEPKLVVCREALRQAQSLWAQSHDGLLKHAIQEVCEVPELIEAEAYLHTRPLKAIRVAEGVLNHLPDSIAAHKILARAALKANMPRTALLSLNFINSHTTESAGSSLELVVALAQAGRTEEALSLCGRLQKDYPRNKRVLRALAGIAQVAFDERTIEMSRPPAPRWGFKSPAANRK